MKSSVCTVIFALFIVFSFDAHGQIGKKVTVREINAIPASNVAQLEALGENLTTADIQSLIFNDLLGELVEIDVIILSEPHNSGLAVVTDGRPQRIHVFARDIAAVSQGVHGMGIQLVDDAYESTGLIEAKIGDVIRVTGTVTPFLTAMQIDPISIEYMGTYQSLGLPWQILNPKVITTDQANQTLSGGGAQVNWQNLSRLNGQFVRLEEATVVARDISTERPHWLISSDGGETILNSYDTSLRFRNDRDGAYPETFNVRDDDFVPPPPGATINLQGFIVNQGADFFGRGVPHGAILSIAPFEDRGCEDASSGLRCDLEVLQQAAAKNPQTASDFIVRNTDESVVEAFSLEPAYPNPFNPTTAIRFSLPTASSVTLVVYDMLGREVTRLVDGIREAGMHEIIFEAGDLPGGAYLYRLETPGGSFTRTMLLLK